MYTSRNSQQDVKDIVFGYIKSNFIHKLVPNDVQFIILVYYWNKNTLVYVVGRNRYDQLGLGHCFDVTTLTAQTNQYQIQHIYNGYTHTIYSDYDNNNYWSTGSNFYGECCLGHQSSVNKLTKITSFINNNIKIKHIFTNISGWQTFWIDIHQNIYGSGYNRFHQLGLGNDSNSKLKPIQIKYLKENIADVQCGSTYTLALDNDNDVYSTGLGHSGALCHGSKYKQIKQFTKVKELNNCNIIKIKAGFNHCLLVSSDYIVYGCGANDCGQLGTGYNDINKQNEYTPVIIEYFQNNNIKVINIECGFDHNLCCDINHNMYSFGRNKYGQCGLGLFAKNIFIPQRIIQNGFKNENIIQIKCGSQHSYCLSSSNSHYLWGDNNCNQCILNKNGMDIITVPYLMNDVFKAELNNQKIKEIFLGDCFTQIIVIDA